MVNRDTERPQRAPQVAWTEQRESRRNNAPVSSGIVQRLANWHRDPSPPSSTKNLHQQTDPSSSPTNTNTTASSTEWFIWNNAPRPENGLSFPKPRQLRIMAAILVVSLVVVQGLVAVVVQFGLDASFSSGGNDGPVTSTTDLTSQDIREPAPTVIPYFETWYRTNVGPGDPLLITGDNHKNYSSGLNSTQLQDDGNCLATLFEDLIAAVPETDPEIVLAVLDRLGLANIPALQSQGVLGDFLAHPQSTQDVLQRSQKCLVASPSMPALICGMVRQYLLLSAHKQPLAYNEEKNGLFENPDWRTFLRDILHYAIVYDAITKALVEQANLSLLQTVTRVLTTTQRQAMQTYLGLGNATGTFGASSDIINKRRKRQLEQLDQVMVELQRYTDTVCAPAHDPPLSLLSGYQSRLQLAILQQSQQQIEQGFDNNAKVGLALAASVTLQPSLQPDQHKLSWRLGHEWGDAYLAWMLAVDMSGDSFHAYYPGAAVPHLWMPSVACSSGDQGENWYAYHTVATALAAVALPGPLKMYEDIPEGSPYYDMVFGGADEEHYKTHYTLAKPLGRINQQTVGLMEPTKSTIDDLFAALHVDDNEESHKNYTYLLTTPWRFNDGDISGDLNLDETEFALYVGFVLIGTSLLAGLGLELVVWSMYIAPLALSWSGGAQETTWRLVQLVLPLLAATAVGLTVVQYSFAALPVLVLALYKLGYPETWMHIQGGLLCHSGVFQRSADLIHGMAGMVHNSAAMWIICFILTGVLPVTHALIHPLLVVLIQFAWCVAVRHCHHGIYVVGALLLESIMEWMVFTELPELHASHWTASQGALVLLVAHWMYLIGGLLELIHVLFVADGRSNEAEQRAMMSSFLSEREELTLAGLDDGDDEASPTRPGKSILGAIPEGKLDTGAAMRRDIQVEDKFSFVTANEGMRNRSARTLSSIEEGNPQPASLLVPLTDEILSKSLLELDMKRSSRSVDQDELKSVTTC